MASMESTVNLNAMAKDITLKVKIKGVKRFLFRLKVAEWLIRLGAFVAGMGIVIEGDES
jgi:hypothetical protein